MLSGCPTRGKLGKDWLTIKLYVALYSQGSCPWQHFDWENDGLTRSVRCDPPVGHVVLWVVDYRAIFPYQRIFYLYIYVLQKNELYTKFRTAVLFLMKTIIPSPNWIGIIAQKHAALNVLTLNYRKIFTSTCRKRSLNIK